ncbi:hypothetical protein ZHAS_00007741 [Anopheles sinensis]|uniref:Uncharacterized protein n=1 Tax=Anopheles sinensis TaxID=74873 RepID=A0A084VQW5_ANOSI|nr:hypothetical protein ZHAS_00007741 [Anopheles sinensis]
MVFEQKVAAVLRFLFKWDFCAVKRPEWNLTFRSSANEGSEVGNLKSRIVATTIPKSRADAGGWYDQKFALIPPPHSSPEGTPTSSTPREAFQFWELFTFFFHAKVCRLLGLRGTFFPVRQTEPVNVSSLRFASLALRCDKVTAFGTYRIKVLPENDDGFGLIIVGPPAEERKT